jgi:hypothetical protein
MATSRRQLPPITTPHFTFTIFHTCVDLKEAAIASVIRMADAGHSFTAPTSAARPNSR